jgi:hypothetical protein
MGNRVKTKIESCVPFNAYYYVTDCLSTRDRQGYSRGIPLPITTLNSLVKEYKVHAKRLRVTGEGITGDPEGPEGAQGGGEPERLQFYILADGPDDATPEFACNIWGMLHTFLLISFRSFHII